MRRVSVVIADAQPMVLRALSNLLSAERDFKIVARCRDGGSCIEAIRSLEPDIAVLDLSMPDMSGLEILSIVSGENLSTRLVFFLASSEHRDLATLAAAGAYGVMLEVEKPANLVRTLRQVAVGQLPFPSTRGAVGRVKTAMTEKDLATLTGRERQIMRLVSKGLSNKEIGRRLNVTDGTIKVHLHHIFQKLDISNRTSLAALAILQDEPNEPSVESRVHTRRLAKPRRRSH